MSDREPLIQQGQFDSVAVPTVVPQPFAADSRRTRQSCWLDERNALDLIKRQERR